MILGPKEAFLAIFDQKWSFLITKQAFLTVFFAQKTSKMGATCLPNFFAHTSCSGAGAGLVVLFHVV